MQKIELRAFAQMVIASLGLDVFGDKKGISVDLIKLIDFLTAKKDEKTNE